MRYSNSILRPTFLLLVVAQLSCCYYSRSQTPDHDQVDIQERQFGEVQRHISSPKVKAFALFMTLQSLEENVGKMKRFLSALDNDDLSPAYNEVNVDVIHVDAPRLQQRKRQVGPGAQICIWKVCPPSPWRREGKYRV